MNHPLQPTNVPTEPHQHQSQPNLSTQDCKVIFDILTELQQQINTSITNAKAFLSIYQDINLQYIQWSIVVDIPASGFIHEMQHHQLGFLPDLIRLDRLRSEALDKVEGYGRLFCRSERKLDKLLERVTRMEGNDRERKDCNGELESRQDDDGQEGEQGGFRERDQEIQGKAEEGKDVDRMCRKIRILKEAVETMLDMLSTAILGEE